MANQEHVESVKQGVEVWNKWGKENPNIKPDLEEVNLIGVNLVGANLKRTNLRRADLSGADLRWTKLSKADLWKSNLKASNLGGADLSEADLFGADLSGADLWRANLHNASLYNASLYNASLYSASLYSTGLRGVDLRRVDLRGSDLEGADLSEALLIYTDFTKANLTGCRIYGISAWDLKLEDAIQKDLVITDYDRSKVTVDNIEVAQFIYLLLNNKKIRQVIDTITSKVVLILGRFTEERKAVLDALREEIRKHNYSPVVFDFDKPTSKDLTETVSTLAHMSRFIIADLTDPSSIPYELATIVPHCVVPVLPLLIDDEKRQEFAMFKDLGRRYSWVLPIYHYANQDMLLSSIKDSIIVPAEKKAMELEQKR